MSEANVNRVLLSGKLVGAPELYEPPVGAPVCFLRLECATKQREWGSEEYRLNYFDVLIVGARARSIARELFKSRRLAIQGRLESACWESSDGREREGVTILAERVQLLSAYPRDALSDHAALLRDPDPIDVAAG